MTVDTQRDRHAGVPRAAWRRRSGSRGPVAGSSHEYGAGRAAGSWAAPPRRASWRSAPACRRTPGRRSPDGGSRLPGSRTPPSRPWPGAGRWRRARSSMRAGPLPCPLHVDHARLARLGVALDHLRAAPWSDAADRPAGQSSRSRSVSRQRNASGSPRRMPVWPALPFHITRLAPPPAEEASCSADHGCISGALASFASGAWWRPGFAPAGPRPRPPGRARRGDRVDVPDGARRQWRPGPLALLVPPS